MSQIEVNSASNRGVDLVFEWQIDHFFSLRARDGVCHYSPSFSFGGESWCLEIVPNGWSRSGSSGHVDLLLWKCISGRSIKQTVSLSLKTAKGEKYNEQHCMKDFKDWPENRHEFRRFIQRSGLTRRRSELVPEGVLTVIGTMKSLSYAGSVSTEVSAECCHCKQTFNAVSLSSHELQKWLDEHECRHERTEGSEASAECCHCKQSFNAVSLSSHELQKWLDEHECQHERTEGEACASGSSTNSQEKKALHDFKELFLKKEDCDVTIKVKGSEFPAHKIILKARSPVLASIFRHHMKGSATGVLEIDDCDPSSFSDFLCFLYCADVQMIAKNNVFEIFTLADKYQVSDLRSKCLEFMKNNLTVDTFCETITLALRHSEAELIKLSTDYFTKNAPKIIVTIKWQTFLAENPTESNQLFIKLLVPNSR